MFSYFSKNQDIINDNNKEEIEKICINEVNKQLSNNYHKVNITDNISKDTQVFLMYKLPDGSTNLYNTNRQKIGIVKPWYDENIPSHLKSKDGYVTDPDTGESLMEFIIENKKLCILPKDIYREYTYLNNHNSLQYNYEIDYCIY
jgi:hypothetical protein